MFRNLFIIILRTLCIEFASSDDGFEQNVLELCAPFIGEKKTNAEKKLSKHIVEIKLQCIENGRTRRLK